MKLYSNARLFFINIVCVITSEMGTEPKGRTNIIFFPSFWFGSALCFFLLLLQLENKETEPCGFENRRLVCNLG